MALQAGARLGPYEILAPLGAGGMGEVYRAWDGRLSRDVAIKLLPLELAAVPERVARFEREARAASALNHPSIVTIYEIGSCDSTPYIAMELVEGESLRAALLEGPMPVRRLLQIGVQVAEGLARAHALGIVHRDLKPENVMVTKDGRAKILDFGLAKLTGPDASSDPSSQPPTAPETTREGVILGTAGYMSPEQAKGAPADYRSDQFSLGSILYEIATGRRAFQRASAVQTMTAIIQDEPEPIASLNPRIPAPLRWTVQRCLAKEAASRYASTEDLARELATIRDNLSDASSGVGAPPVTPVIARRRWRIPGAIAAAILLVLGGVGWRLRESDYFWRNPLAGARFTRLTDWEGSEFDAAISSDGKFVAFVSDQAGPFDAWVMQVGSNEVRNLSRGLIAVPYGDRRRNVGFSGDDSHVWIGISHVGPTGPGATAWLFPTLGGSPRPFLNRAVSIAWSPDRARLVYHTPDVRQLMFVADRNGASEKQIFVGEPGFANNYPVWSPDGRFIYVARGITTTNDMDIWRIPSGGGVAERLTNHHARVSYPAFLDAHTLVYAASRRDGSGSGLYAMDVDRRVPHAVSFGLEEYLSVSASADGRRLVATVANPTSQLWTVPITDHVVDEGTASRVSVPAVRAAAPRFGAGQLYFLSSKGGEDGLWSLKDGVATELWHGSDGAVTAPPALSPDGARLCLVVRHGERRDLWVMAADGTGSRRLAESLDARDTPSWSPDGRWIAVAASEGKEQPLFKVPVDGGPPQRLAGGVDMSPVWSPDGTFIVYSEKGDGPRAVVKAITPEGQPFALPQTKIVSTGGTRYRFLPGGKAIVLMLQEERAWDFWRLDLATGNLRRLTDLRQAFGMRSFDVSPDGTQILFDRYRDNSDVVLIDLPSR